MKKCILAFLWLLSITSRVFCQVTIGEDKAPESFSVLELIGNNKGFRLPQLTTSQRDAITDVAFKANTNAQGLMIFNLTCKCVEVWNGSQWISFFANGDGKTEKAVWKVLWAICPVIDATVKGIHYQTSMTADEIEIVKLKAAWFEEFIEKYTNNKVDIQVTIDIIQNPIVTLNPGENNTVWEFQMPMEDRFRLKPEDNFDCQILTADYTGISKASSWLGITNSAMRTSWIAFCHSGCGEMEYGGYNPNATIKQLHTDIYVHEWLHQLEYYFPTIDPDYQMPVLHNNETDYKYTTVNTGLTGESRLEKWYIDYLQGTIIHYPMASGTCNGVDPDWWQYPPLYWRSNITTSPANYAENVQVSPTVIIKWSNPVEQNWSADNYHVVLKDGVTGMELGFYRVTGMMSADKKTLTIDFSQPLYKMWDNVNAVVNFERGKIYQLTSYMLVYSNPTTTPQYIDANFNIMFKIEP